MSIEVSTAYPSSFSFLVTCAGTLNSSTAMPYSAFLYPRALRASSIVA